MKKKFIIHSFLLDVMTSICKACFSYEKVYHFPLPIPKDKKKIKETPKKKRGKRMNAFTIFALGPLHASNDYIPWLLEWVFFFFSTQDKKRCFLSVLLPPFLFLAIQIIFLFIYLFLC